VKEPVEFDRVVPASGNLWAMGRQFWLGPSRAEEAVRFWAGVDTIRLTSPGARVKKLRSHLGAADLERLLRNAAAQAGPPRLPAAENDTRAVEVDRNASRNGMVVLAGRRILAAESLEGRRISIRVEPPILTFFDHDTRALLRTRPNPVTAEEVRGLHGTPSGRAVPRSSTEPVTVRRRVSGKGVITRSQTLLVSARACVSVHPCREALVNRVPNQRARSPYPRS
jgi:hypothetical protein